MKLLWVTLLGCAAALAGAAQTVPNIKVGAACPNIPGGVPKANKPSVTSGDFRVIKLTAPNALCNDGSSAAILVRAARAGAAEPDGPSANRWVIHLEGGGGCSTFLDCLVRWCGLGYYTIAQMSSDVLGDFINKNGLLGRNNINRLGDRNLVMLNYCSSDGWEGRKSDVVLTNPDNPAQAYSLHYRGATILDAAIDALERGVEGMPRLTAATDILLSGDSAGANGVRNHVDRFAARMKALNPAIRVRANMEATFAPDFNGKQGFPAGDPKDPVFAAATERFNQVRVGLYGATPDESCMAAHPGSSYLCTDPGYLEANHITTPFYQIQDVIDPNLMENYEGTSLVFTPASFGQGLHDQITALANIKNTAVERAAITTAPGVAGRLCGVHVTWSNDDGFLGKKISSGPGTQAFSYYELLWNWMQGQPTVLIEPKPPLQPDEPVKSAACGNRAPSATMPAIATASSASYNFGGTVAPESIVTTFGTNLAAATATATTTPWPTTLGNIQVRVTDSKGSARTAPIYYVSPSQILYLIPAGTATGTAQIDIGAQRTTVEVTATAPAIYSASQTGKGVAAASYIRITSRGVRTEGLLFDALTGQDTGVPAAVGDQIYLLLYGTGLRGGPATATIGDVQVPVAGPVAQGQYQGLDQINLGPLPLRIGLGQKQIVIRQGDDLANVVTVTFKTAQ